MKIYNDENLQDLDTWCGATATKQQIIDSDKTEEFENLIDESFPEGLSAVALNDILWFEEEWIFENLGIDPEKE